jgi:hypothetical protein
MVHRTMARNLAVYGLIIALACVALFGATRPASAQQIGDYWLGCSNGALDGQYPNGVWGAACVYIPMSIYLWFTGTPGVPFIWASNPGELPCEQSTVLRLGDWHTFTGGSGGDADYSAMYPLAVETREKFVKAGFYVWAADYEWNEIGGGGFIAPNVLNTATYSIWLYDQNYRLLDSQTNMAMSYYDTTVTRGEGGLTGIWAKYHVVHRVITPDLCMFGRTGGVCNDPAPGQSAPAGTHFKLRFAEGGQLVDNNLYISGFSLGYEGTDPQLCPSQFPLPTPMPTATVDPSATATPTVDPASTATPSPVPSNTPAPGTTSTPRPVPTAWATPWQVVVVPPPATPVPFATPLPLVFPPLILPTLASIAPANTPNSQVIGAVATPAAAVENWQLQLGAISTRVAQTTEQTGEFTASVNEPISQTAYIATRWAEPVNNAEAEFETQSTSVISNTNQMTGYLSFPVRAFLVVPTLLPSTWFFFATVLAASGLVMATHILKFLIALVTAIIGVIRAIWEAIPFN